MIAHSLTIINRGLPPIVKVIDFAKIVQSCSGIQLIEALRIFIGGIIVTSVAIASLALTGIIALSVGLAMMYVTGKTFDYYLTNECGRS